MSDADTGVPHTTYFHVTLPNAYAVAITPEQTAVIAAAVRYCDAALAYNKARSLGLSHLQADTPNTACLDAAHEIHVAVKALRAQEAL